MTKVTGFPPICNPNASILILGSMPGIQSLTASEYYAHPRNAFWSIIEAIYGINRSLTYDARISALKKTNIALWDVLAECNRQGSLDSAIETQSSIVNDFVAFFAQFPAIERIVFNGKAAEKLFMRNVLPLLSKKNLHLHCAPSTSPAHAISLSDKIASWRIALFA